MKKVMLATWLLAIGGFAQAQSSVTLYGRIDTGLEYMSGLTNGSGRSVSRLRAESGDWGTGMFGLKGVEDIGGGTKVIFQLEGGLNSMVGQVGSGTTIFNRWAYVGGTERYVRYAHRRSYVVDLKWSVGLRPTWTNGVVVGVARARPQLASKQQ